MEAPNFSTDTVSVLGGDPHLFLKMLLDLAGSVQIKFSSPGSTLESISGVAVTASRHQAITCAKFYFPSHERGMAHFSSPSPDRKWILVVEMNQYGGWAPCRLVSLEGRFQTKSVGPIGGCTAAGWSPDGSWMYFAAALQGHSHLWRQHFPDGSPEQITFGPTDDHGDQCGRAPLGHSLITSLESRAKATSGFMTHPETAGSVSSSEGEVVT